MILALFHGAVGLQFLHYWPIHDIISSLLLSRNTDCGSSSCLVEGPSKPGFLKLTSILMTEFFMGHPRSVMANCSVLKENMVHFIYHTEHIVLGLVSKHVITDQLHVDGIQQIFYFTSTCFDFYGQHIYIANHIDPKRWPKSNRNRYTLPVYKQRKDM